MHWKSWSEEWSDKCLEGRVVAGAVKELLVIVFVISDSYSVVGIIDDPCLTVARSVKAVTNKLDNEL